MTGFYNLQKISGSVMIENGQNIRCTHKGLLDVICIQKDGSTAKDKWEIKVVLQLNHDLFRFKCHIEWLADEWKIEKNCNEIELFKKGHNNFRFERRMIPSGSSW